MTTASCTGPAWRRRPSTLNPSIYQVAQTPAIDRLADEGLAFTHGYTTPLCRPSLASIITGAYPHQHWITGNDLVEPARRTTTVEARMQVLQPAAAHARHPTRLHQLPDRQVVGRPPHQRRLHPGDTVNSTAGRNRRRPSGAARRPSYVAARHGDWGLMTGRVDYVNDIAAPGPPDPLRQHDPDGDRLHRRPGGRRPAVLPLVCAVPPAHPARSAGRACSASTTPSSASPNESGNYFAKYYANIERFDGGVGAILDHLDAKGIADNTIVVLICDNGWINQTNASAYAARSKQTPYEGRHPHPDHRALAGPHQGGRRDRAPGHHHPGQPGRPGADRARRPRPADLPGNDRREPVRSRPRSPRATRSSARTATTTSWT